MSDSNKDDENTSGCSGDPANCGKNMNAGQVAANAQNMEDCLGRSMESLSKAFSASARRWELIVYPSLVAFIILALYGGFLIYRLTTDVHKVTSHMEAIAKDMRQVSQNMVLITQTVDAQSVAMRDMALHMRNMSIAMGQMRYDISVMNHNVSRPMSFMNSFMPW